jgi:hypothetical protein
MITEVRSHTDKVNLPELVLLTDLSEVPLPRGGTRQGNASFGRATPTLAAAVG